MELKTQAIYNKTLSITALIGILASLLLSFQKSVFSPVPVYGSIAFAVIMFIGYFMTNYFLYGQDSALYILACFVSQLGLTMLYRINPQVFLKQITWFCLGVLIFIFVSILARFWIDVDVGSTFFFGVTVLMLILPLLIGVERGGSKSWIQFHDHLFQPSELAKITFGLFLAKTLEDGKVKNWWLFAIQILSILGVLMASRDLGAVMLFYLTAVIVVFVATSRWDFLAIASGAAVVGGLLGYLTFGHVRVRIEAWLNPWKDVPGKGYQIVQSLFAMAQGGFFGTGLGMGHPEYIPAVTTDFIFSAIFEEFGFLGAAAVIVVYFLMVYRGIKISISVENSYLSLAALSITTMFGFQIITIIGGVTKLIPLTGVTLPFMSYGGSSMVMSFASLAILNGIWLKGRGDENGEPIE